MDSGSIQRSNSMQYIKSPYGTSACYHMTVTYMNHMHIHTYTYIIVSPHNSMKFINNAGSYAQNNAAAELAAFEQVICVCMYVCMYVFIKTLSLCIYVCIYKTTFFSTFKSFFHGLPCCDCRRKRSRMLHTPR